MTTETDLINDEKYEAAEPVLDNAIDEAVDFLIEEYGFSGTDIENILYNWFNSSGPKEQFTIKNAEQLIKENKHGSNLN
tara:strand:+ start:312 stop:548 length:237 start_codon:yes stop_codon:yes gene_type:complete